MSAEVAEGPPTQTPVSWENSDSETGRCANTDPLLDRLDLDNEGSGPMAIMPTDETTGTNPPDVYAERMSRVDGCGECVTNVEAPSSVYATPDGFLANYVCLSCGHAWSTSWRD